MNTDRFTDHCAVTRGLQIAQQEAPLFSAYLAAIKENMERVAEETAKMGFPSTAKAMKDFAGGLRHE